MKMLQIIGFIILAFVMLPFVLKLVFGLLGITIALTVLAFKLALYGGLAWLLYKGYRAITA